MHDEDVAGYPDRGAVTGHALPDQRRPCSAGGIRDGVGATASGNPRGQQVGDGLEIAHGGVTVPSRTVTTAAPVPRSASSVVVRMAC